MEIVLHVIFSLNCNIQINVRYEDCIRDCEMALSLNGKFSKGYARLARSYLALGNYQRAHESYEKAMEVTPTDKELVEESKRSKVVLIVLYRSLWN